MESTTPATSQVSSPKSALRTALITGASSGIGTEYALQLGKTGRYNLILVARRADRLAALEKEIKSRSGGARAGWVRSLKVDLTQRSEVESMLMLLEEERIDIELLVNNAGFGTVAPFLEADLAGQQQMVELNCVAPLTLMHRLLPGMCARGSGAVINVASTASFQPLPYMATYAATKAFLTSLGLALNEEVSRFGVRVLTHCPGPTKTEFHLVSGLPEKMTFIPSAPVESVVREALAALGAEKKLIINGFLNRALARLARLLPVTSAAPLAERILRRKSQSSSAGKKSY